MPPRARPVQTKTPEAEVSPSRRDPINDWLDLFLRMLSLSKAESAAVRDELEDHLRSRVDDLLITGSSEHDAVLQAVGELGETAELARRFKQASHPSRRRHLMSTALIAIAGSALTLGAFSVFNPPTNVATLTGAAGSTGNAVAFVAPPGEAAPFDETLRKYDITVLLMDPHQPVSPYLRSMSSGFISNRANEIVKSLTRLVTPDLWDTNGGDQASIVIMDNTLFVTAPAETHQGVQWVLESLIADAQKRAAAAEEEAARWDDEKRAAQERQMAESRQRNIEREAAYEQGLVEDAAHRLFQIEELKAKYADLKAAYIDVTRTQTLMELQGNDLEYQWRDAEGEEREKMAIQLAETRAQGAETQLRYDDTRNRLNRVGSLLMNLELAEYEHPGAVPQATPQPSAPAPSAALSTPASSDSLERRRQALLDAVAKGTLTREKADEMMERALQGLARGSN